MANIVNSELLNRGLCKGRCKHCRHFSADFAEDEHNIYYLLVCNKFNETGETIAELHNNILARE